jgi:hypothetical protein
MKYIFILILGLVSQRVAAQCQNGQCYAPQYIQSYPSYQSSYVLTYPSNYSYPVLYSGDIYARQGQVYQDCSTYTKQQTELVPVNKSKLTTKSLVPPTLEGPSQIKVGELAVLRVKNAVTKVAWIVIPQKINFQEFENGSSAAFCTNIAGNYSFFAAVGSGNDLVVLPHQIVVIDDRPSPIPPGPGPNPPIPTPTDLKSSVKLAVTKVKSPQRVKEANYLAFSFISVANLIKSANITDSNTIISVTTASNRQALGQSAELWAPFFEFLAATLNTMSKNGQLKTPEDHISTWNIIADALKETT